MKLTKLKRLRAAIEETSEGLTDEAAAYVPELFPMWKPDGDYVVGERVQWKGKLYKVLIAHTSQEQWTPDAAVSLYAVILIPDPSVIPEWAQPGSTNAYMKGDKVRHNGKVWVSTIDNNVWEPGVYGWDEVA